jgi:hypothetical protein
MHASCAFDIPADQPFRKVRDFLQRNTHPTLFDSNDVAQYFGADITAELLAKGLIEPEIRHKGKFQVSPLGTRLAAKRLIPRIPRAKADKIVAEMLTRARNTITRRNCSAGSAKSRRSAASSQMQRILATSTSRLRSRTNILMGCAGSTPQSRVPRLLDDG